MAEISQVEDFQYGSFNIEPSTLYNVRRRFSVGACISLEATIVVVNI